MHGGIGFTWEHDTNVYYRRAIVLAACFGRAADYPQQVVDVATSTGMRPIDIDLDPDTEKLREEIRAEVAALKAIPSEERNTAIAEGGWVQPHLPTPWGRAAAADRADHHRPGVLHAGAVKRPPMGIAAWIIPSIVAYGTDAQQQRFLPPTFRGEMIWCQLFSEPGAGSDLASLTTKATKVDGGWRITGQKIWTTGAQYSQWGALLARTNPSAPKHGGITYFLLDMASEGVEIKPLRELTGNAMFNTVFIDDVFVPDELVLGEVDRGWEVSRNTLTNERVSIGSSEPPFLASLEQFVEFLRDGQFDQIEQNEAGKLIAEGHAAKLLNMRSTLLTLAGGDPMPAAAISQAAVDEDRPGLRRVRGVVVRHRRGHRRPGRAVRQVGRVPAGRPRHDDLRRHLGGAAQHHRRAPARPAPRSVGRRPRRVRHIIASREFGWRSPRAARTGVTLRQLRYFAVLGEELNYRRAAERLFITQPALSTAIKQLEQHFGVVLFNRNTREVALTDLGAAWLPQVQQAHRGRRRGGRQPGHAVGHPAGQCCGSAISSAPAPTCCSAWCATSRPPTPRSPSNPSSSTSPTRPPGWPRHHRGRDDPAAGRPARAPDADARLRVVGGLPAAGPPRWPSRPRSRSPNCSTTRSSARR